MPPEPSRLVDLADDASGRERVVHGEAAAVEEEADALARAPIQVVSEDRRAERLAAVAPQLVPVLRLAERSETRRRMKRVAASRCADDGAHPASNRPASPEPHNQSNPRPPTAGRNARRARQPVTMLHGLADVELQQNKDHYRRNIEANKRSGRNIIF